MKIYSFTPLTFTYTGSYQTFVVPINVKSLKITAKGAAGGPVDNASGGNGGCMTAVIIVVPLSTLYIYVGGMGGSGGANGNMNPGFNGGAVGASRSTAYNWAWQGSSGGGATDIRTSLEDLHSRLVVAGGGGGVGHYAMGSAGSGGGIIGESGSGGWNCNGGGATASAGGSGCGGTSSGTFGEGSRGGACGTYVGGGGGGGYYGGGGACSGPGGGGSGYAAASSLISSSNGCNDGNGMETEFL